MAALGQNLVINGERLWDSLMEMAKIAHLYVFLPLLLCNTH